MDDNVATVKTLLANVSKCLGAVGQSRGKGGSFNVFRLCQIDHYENAHSRILAEFLNPRGTHGFKDGAFLREFFKMISSCVSNQRKESLIFGKFESDTYVRTELSEKIGGEPIGRFDIYIENARNKVVCIIENKIYAGEQPEQLSRYARWLADRRKAGYKTCLVFLTLDGHESKTISNHCDYVSVAYKNSSGSDRDILSWLQKCRMIACDRPFVRETIAQYSEHINNIATGGTVMQNKVIDELINGSNLSAAQYIYESYCAARDLKANALFDDFLKYISGKLELNFTTEGGLDSGHKEAGCSLVFKELNAENITLKVFIGFELTALRGLFIGVTKDDWPFTTSKHSQEVLKMLRQEGREFSNWDSSQWWPVWRYIESMSDWDGKALSEISGKYDSPFYEMYKTVKRIVDAVKQGLSDCDMV